MGRSTWKKKKRKKKIGLVPKITAVVIFFVISTFVLFFTDSFGFASSLRSIITASSAEVIEPEGVQVIDGDYTIDSPDQRLEDLHITGDLYLGPGIGEGSVDLINVTVDGPVLVQGGGFETVFMHDCNFKEVKVNRLEGRVRLVLSGKTVFEQVVLETGARLIENLSGAGFGVSLVEVVTDDKVELAGQFNTIHIRAKEADVELDSEQLKNLIVANTADMSRVIYPDGILIGNMQLDGSTYLFGRAAVEQTTISASGATELEGNFDRVKVTAEAGYLDLVEGSAYRELVVTDDALNNILNLNQAVTIGELKLNEAVEVKGKGEIEKVYVNAPGSVIEQIPLDIEFMQEVSVEIAGYEISSADMLHALRDHGDPDYAAEKSADPDTAEPDLEPEAGPEPERDTGTGTTGTEETGTASSQDTETTGSEAEDETAAEKEDDPDAQPEIIELFAVSEEGIITPGKKLVVVILDVPDPQNYEVAVGGHDLGEYREAINGFRGEVDKADAEESKVVATAR